MQKRQSVSQKFTYWLKVVSLGLILGLGLQFAQAWVAPTVAPPGGNVSGPVTTGGNQTKTGSLTTSGLSAPSLVDSDNAARYVNPSGTSALWSLTLASLPTCDLKTDASGAVYCGTDAGGSSYLAGTGLTLSGSTFSINNTQTQTRVTGTCSAGSSIRVINQDGTVACETDDLGAAGGVSGGGTANYLSRWSTATNLVDSVLYQHGTNAVVGGTDSLGYKFGVYGTIGATGNITTAGKVYSAATIATDGASTLTTKGYVDGKVGSGSSNPFSSFLNQTKTCNTSANGVYTASVNGSGDVTLCSDNNYVNYSCKTFYAASEKASELYYKNTTSWGAATRVYLSAFNRPVLEGLYLNTDETVLSSCSVSF